MHKTSQICWGTLIIHICELRQAVWMKEDTSILHKKQDSQPVALNKVADSLTLLIILHLSINAQFSPDMHIYVHGLCTEGMILLGTVTSAILPRAFVMKNPDSHSNVHYEEIEFERHRDASTISITLILSFFLCILSLLMSS